MCTRPKTRCTSAACGCRSGALRNFIRVVAPRHRIGARTGDRECLKVTVTAAFGPTLARSVEARTASVRRACTRKEICRLPAGVQARKVPGHQTLAGPKSSVRPIGGPCGVRQSPIEHACLRQSPIEQDLHGRDARGCVQHPSASAHSWCER